MTAADLPQPVPRFGPQFEDRPVIAVGETKYHGEPVAIVAAETKDAAEEAAGLVRVEYEELPAVFTLAAALDPEAPLVQEPGAAPERPRSRVRTSSASTGSAGATSRPRRPTSSSSTPTRSRW